MCTLSANKSSLRYIDIFVILNFDLINSNKDPVQYNGCNCKGRSWAFMTNYTSTMYFWVKFIEGDFPAQIW